MRLRRDAVSATVAMARQMVPPNSMRSAPSSSSISTASAWVAPVCCRAARVAHLPGAERVFRRGLVARDLVELGAAVGLPRASLEGEITKETAEEVARAARKQSGATHALAVLIDLDEGPDRIEFGGTICLAIATEVEAASRRSRILGGREWVRLGAVEMGLDCLRRYLQGLPVYERIDFEKT